MPVQSSSTWEQGGQRPAHPAVVTAEQGRQFVFPNELVVDDKESLVEPRASAYDPEPAAQVSARVDWRHRPSAATHRPLVASGRPSRATAPSREAHRGEPIRIPTLPAIALVSLVAIIFATGGKLPLDALEFIFRHGTHSTVIAMPPANTISATAAPVATAVASEPASSSAPSVHGEVPKVAGEVLNPYLETPGIDYSHDESRLAYIANQQENMRRTIERMKQFPVGENIPVEALTDNPLVLGYSTAYYPTGNGVYEHNATTMLHMYNGFPLPAGKTISFSQAMGLGYVRNWITEVQLPGDAEAHKLLMDDGSGWIGNDICHPFYGSYLAALAAGIPIWGTPHGSHNNPYAIDYYDSWVASNGAESPIIAIETSSAKGESAIEGTVANGDIKIGNDDEHPQLTENLYFITTDSIYPEPAKGGQDAHHFQMIIARTPFVSDILAAAVKK